MNLLNQIMSEKDISARILSQRTGIPKQTIDAYRQNRRAFSLVNALLIADALDVSPYDLVEAGDWKRSLESQ